MLNVSNISRVAVTNGSVITNHSNHLISSYSIVTNAIMSLLNVTYIAVIYERKYVIIVVTPRLTITVDKKKNKG